MKLKVVELFIVAAMLVACAPKAATTVQNSVVPAKENSAQDKVDRDSTSTLKDRSKNDIEAVFYENSPKRLNVVYNNYLKKRRGFEGEILARIMVLPNGDVEKVEIVSATTNYPEFEKAISDDLLQWKYGSGDYNKCTFKIPLKFQDENDNAQVKNEDGLTILKGRSGEKIKQTIMINTPNRLKPLYNNFLRTNPGFEGKISVKFKILADGNVETGEIVSATTNFPEFEKAVLNDILQWKFDAGDYTNCTVTVPFTFTDDGKPAKKGPVHQGPAEDAWYGASQGWF